ncbi:MAG: folate-binding protein YgfZ [Dechloromonas sp.]|jgi:folate-binding protein YgfZ|nr:folate-binding protein YgfZ [Dechloromonas sp.]
MNSFWRPILETAGAVCGPDSNEIDHFGDAAAESAAARDATVVVPLLHLGVIGIEGDDAKSFLHNQLTSDINHLGEAGAQHSAWCTAKGRMLASFLVWRQGEGYRLALAAELVSDLAKRFRMYILRAKATVTDLSGTLLLIGLSGPRAAEALSAAGLPKPDGVLEVGVEGDTRVMRLDADRLVVAVPEHQAAAAWAALTAIARPAGTGAWRWLDVRAGLPLVTGATREEFVPQMADFEKIGGVSFHKGCYPGQEVVARTQYLGKVKRHLYRVSCPAPLVAGCDLHSPDNPDQASGKIVLAAPSPAGGYEALAVVQSNFSSNLRLGSQEGIPVEAVAVNS